MQKLFTIPSLKAEKIKNAISKAWYTRLVRLADLDEFFDNERDIMVRHYTDKMKKNKKLKDTVASLKAISMDTKLLILAHWYVHKMSANNLINAIFFNASKSAERGGRGKPGDPLYNKLTEAEFKNLNSLYLNKDKSTEYLFKGIKEDLYPVG
jgi:hypothetical protein